MGRITGRSDDMIILRGVNLFPSQIEEIALRIPELSPHFQLELTRPEGQRMDQLTVKIERRESVTVEGVAAGRQGPAAADQDPRRVLLRRRRRRSRLPRAFQRQAPPDLRHAPQGLSPILSSPPAGPPGPPGGLTDLLIVRN